MKYLLAFIALPVLLILVASCGEESARRPDRPPGTDPDSLFLAEVIPALREACGTCHFSGGDMYPNFPFDDPVTLRDRGEEVLGRMEDGEARYSLEDWLGVVRRQDP
jgi:hypothetical protein